ncbi:Predicted hydrolase of the alpha/beta superfamily [Pedobacter westerhofensis]|uniref:Predicted hydrolase of the alpha/beta superfamily n=1 Tax=Pedobacter westerhofensis TaxID=425512 RepID=A0A521FSE0_9SPHI|nr:alpha/beta hydrolase-fold protein [Pedobacter westerhofensis]SMO99147.1 Predicted hydrolase of the alpha/beta superfamily [Pedobacter westerhofensis]
MNKSGFYLFLFLIYSSFSVNAQSFDTLSINSKVFNAVRKIKVALPVGYNDYPNLEKKYIVAYLFDAQSDGFFNFYKTTANYLAEQGYMQQLILVGISSDNRQYEFTPKAQTKEGLKSFLKSGGADQLAMHMKNEVLPVIESKYRSISYNIGVGHSLGATFVSYSLLKHPELFNAVIAISPNFQYDNEQIVHKLDSCNDKDIFNHKFLYLAHGNRDYTEEKFKSATTKFDSLLNKRNFHGLRWKFKNLDNNNHGTTAMEGIFKGLYELNSQLTLSQSQIELFYKSKSFIESVKDYYESASTWSSLKLPFVDDLNTMGYNCYYSGKNKEAIQIFEWALSIYPSNLNLYDSMGEVQENTGNKGLALTYYTKGINLLKEQKAYLAPKIYNEQLSYFESKLKSIKN